MRQRPDEVQRTEHHLAVCLGKDPRRRRQRLCVGIFVIVDIDEYWGWEA